VRVAGLACLAISFTLTGAPTQTKDAIDRAFQEFWSADDRDNAAGRIDAIFKTGVSYDEALSRLQRGRDYDADVPRGMQLGRTRTFDGVEHRYAFVVPESYDPAHAYPVRVHLHGGVARPRPADRIRTDSLPGPGDEIHVFPSGWAESLWWSATQVDNLNRILDRLKRTYNIDENRVYLTGSSDGGTGAYFMAFKDTTPWASFVPVIADMMVLSSPSVGVDVEIFPGNAVNKPLYVVNGGRDRLYPAHLVELYVRHLKTLGASVVFRVYAESGHTTEWWPDERAAVAAFVRDHPREPLPDTISWQTERVDRFNRAHWLIIERLGTIRGEVDLPDSNILRRGREYDFGLRVDPGIDGGRRISEVLPRSSAFRLGLRAGDRFVEAQGNPIQTGRDLSDGMQRWAIGAPLRVMVEREGQQVELQGVFDPAVIDVAPAPLFPRTKKSGRVDLVRRGNRVNVSTQGVRALTLLLSSLMFDFANPVVVVANGRTVFEGRIEPSVKTLMKWAARDNDRKMVFGAELNIDLGE
jgi:hypothetical protein